MDRRRRKTRQAVFDAFVNLLSKKKFSEITVCEIIEKADVGRATFYAHFETKEYLLKDLCDELFCHIFDAFEEDEKRHRHIFECSEHGDIFYHLLVHIKNNDNGLSGLLTGENNEIFAEYFRKGLVKLLINNGKIMSAASERGIDEGLWIDHVSLAFVEIVKWWQREEYRKTAEEITASFYACLGIKNC